MCDNFFRQKKKGSPNFIQDSFDKYNFIPITGYKMSLGWTKCACESFFWRKSAKTITSLAFILGKSGFPVVETDFVPAAMGEFLFRKALEPLCIPLVIGGVVMSRTRPNYSVFSQNFGCCMQINHGCTFKIN